MAHTNSRGHIGIVGLGELGSALAEELTTSGFKLCCLDHRPNNCGTHLRADKIGIPFYSDPKEYAGRVTKVLVTVTDDQSKQVIRELAPVLSADSLYIDCSTKSPQLRDELYRIAQDCGLRFVDAALVDSVRVQGQQVRIVLSGPGAEPAAEIFDGSRFVAQVITGPRPVSAELKLCRSMFTKGQEALLIETLSAAEALGVRDLVFENLRRVVDRDLRTTCDVTVGSTLRHARRRAREMRAASDQASRLLGSAPLTEAVSQVFETIARKVPDPSIAPAGGWERAIEHLVEVRLFQDNSSDGPLSE